MSLTEIMIIYFQTINQAYFSRSKSLQICEKIFKKSAFNGNLHLSSWISHLAKINSQWNIKQTPVPVLISMPTTKLLGPNSHKIICIQFVLTGKGDKLLWISYIFESVLKKRTRSSSRIAASKKRKTFQQCQRSHSGPTGNWLFARSSRTTNKNHQKSFKVFLLLPHMTHVCEFYKKKDGHKLKQHWFRKGAM